MKPLYIAQGFFFGLAAFFPIALSTIYVSNAITESEQRAVMVAMQPTKPTNQVN